MHKKSRYTFGIPPSSKGLNWKQEYNEGYNSSWGSEEDDEISDSESDKTEGSTPELDTHNEEEEEDKENIEVQHYSFIN